MRTSEGISDTCKLDPKNNTFSNTCRAYDSFEGYFSSDTDYETLVEAQIGTCEDILGNTNCAATAEGYTAVCDSGNEPIILSCFSWEREFGGVCVNCPAGRQQHSTDSAQCEQCPADTFRESITDDAECTPCSANEVQTDNGVSCRERKAADCGSMFFVSGTKTCRPAESGDCTDNRKYPVVADGVITCTACGTDEVKADDGLSCQEREAADCGNMFFVSGTKTCRPAEASDCADNRKYPVVSNGVLTCTACESTEVKRQDGLNCRPRTMSDCTDSAKPVLDGQTNICRERRAGDCPANMPVLDGQTNACRERRAEDCGVNVFASGECRPPQKSDCDEDGEYPVVADGVLTCTECAATDVETADGLNCRPRTMSDCTDSAKPVLDGQTNTCRERRAGDCPVNMPFFDGGECREMRASDCPAGTVFASGACRPPQKDDCREDNEIPNPQNGLANCTACESGEMKHADGLQCIAETGGNTCAAPRISDGADGCICPAGTEDNPATSDANDCRAVCAAGMIRGDNGNCMCPSDEIEINGACQTRKNCETDGPAGSELNAANECECPADKPNLYAAGETSHCTETLPAPERYTVNECESAGWEFAAAVNNNLIRETCGIPVRVELSFAPPESSGVRAQAVDAADGGVYDSCILREHDNFGGADLPKCEDETLFGESGLPQKPAGFDAAGASARIVVATTGIFYNNAAVPRFTFSRGGGGGNIDRGDIAIATGMAAFIGLIVYGSWDGNPNAFSFSPRTSFSHNNGRTSYSYGSRLDFEQDELSAYWSANRLGGVLAENWRYGAGIKYGKEFWSANFDSINTGGETEIDFGISAAWKEGARHWRSGITADYRTDGIENDFAAFWRNSMTLDYGNWRLSPSTDFRWRDGEILDGGDFRIDLRREF